MPSFGSFTVPRSDWPAAVPPAPKSPAALEGDLMRFLHVLFSPDGKRVLATGGDWKPGGACQVTVWDVASRKQVGKLAGHDFSFVCLTFSPDGKTIATVGLDNDIRLW